jgi:hypothetical protein
MVLPEGPTLDRVIVGASSGPVSQAQSRDVLKQRFLVINAPTRQSAAAAPLRFVIVRTGSRR